MKNSDWLKWFIMITIFVILNSCTSKDKYEKVLTDNIYIVGDDAFPERALVQMDEDNNYHLVALNIFELKGNDSILCLVDTSNYSTNYFRLNIKKLIYPEDLKPITSHQYDSILATIKIKYSYP